MSGRFHVFLLVSLTTASAVQLSNRTIDDEYGDSATRVLPQYSGHWVQGDGCDGCAIKLDIAKLFRRTWHGTATLQDEDPAPKITLRFTGVAVYVYNVLANSVPSARFPTSTSLRFTLDDAPDGQFVHRATDSTQFLFNQLVYVRTDLAHGEHVLVMQPSTAPESLCMFDYALYTFFNESAAPSSTSSRVPSSLPSSQSISALSTFIPSSTLSPSLSSPTSEPGATLSNSSSCSAPCPTSLENSQTELATPMPSQMQAAKQNSASLGGIIGGSMGGAATFLVLIAALWVYMRAKHPTMWSWLPPYEGTGTETRQTRSFASREVQVREGILHITSSRSCRPGNSSHTTSPQNSAAPPAEDVERGAEVIRDSRLSVPSLFSDQPISSQSLGLVASGRGGHGTSASPHTSTEVVVDGKLEFPDIARPIGSARRSASPTSVARSMDTSSNEEVLSQLTSLRAEVAGLRAQQEAQRRFMEAPPRYGDGM